MFKEMPKPTAKVFPFASFRKSWASALERAGLGRIRVHDLRHTAASIMLNELGVDVLTVKEILGHADLNTTMRYLHKDASNMERAVEAMAGWLDKTRIRLGQPVFDGPPKSLYYEENLSV
jgi:integrase